MVATILDTTPQSLMVIPEIRSPQDLKGKKLGVTRFGALSDFGVRKYLQTVGLDPNKDVTILQLGGLPEILAAHARRGRSMAALCRRRCSPKPSTSATKR